MVLQRGDQGVGRGEHDALAQRVVLQPGSASQAAASSDSPGMNATTNSGERSNCFQYSFLASWSTCVRSWPACFLRRALRVVLVVGLGELQEGVERDLRVDDDLAAARQVHDHVGPQKPVLGRRRPLLLEVAVLGHAGRLDGVAQRHFAPAPARLRRPQCGDQVPGLLLQLLVPEVQRRHPLAQGGVGALALDLHVPEPALVAGQRLAQRVQQLGDRLLALREVALGCRADLVELGVGERQELLVVLRQCLCRQAPRRSRPAGRAPPRPGAPLSRSDVRSRSSSDTATARAVSAAAAASDRRFQLGRQRRRARLRIGQTTLGQARGAGGAGRARHMPGKADGEAGGEPDDHSEDHGANVTMGCVNVGDRPTHPACGAGPARIWGSSAPEGSR